MARWAWAGFTALGLGALAFIQNSSYLSVRGGSPSPYAPMGADTATNAPAPAPRPKVHRNFKDEARARLIELQIELAWLADPLTVACPLDAHVDRCLIEITGVVPSVVAHARAIQLASESSDRSLVDALTVKTMAGPEPAREVPPNLKVDALRLLQEGLPKLVQDLRLETTEDGRVLLFGSVPSYEEKLLISQRLRTLKGCGGVENRMNVWGYEDQGKRYSRVTVDGRLRVPADLSAPPPQKIREPEPVAKAATARPAFVPPPGAFEGHVTVRAPLFERLRTHDAVPSDSGTAVAQAARPTQLPATIPSATDKKQDAPVVADAKKLTAAVADAKKPTPKVAEPKKETPLFAEKKPAPAVADAKKPTEPKKETPLFAEKKPTPAVADAKKPTPAVTDAKKSAPAVADANKTTPAAAEAKKRAPSVEVKKPRPFFFADAKPMPVASDAKKPATVVVVEAKKPVVVDAKKPAAADAKQPVVAEVKKPEPAVVPVANPAASDYSLIEPKEKKTASAAPNTAPKQVAGSVVKTATLLPSTTLSPADQTNRALFKIVTAQATPNKAAQPPSGAKQADVRDVGDKKPTVVQASAQAKPEQVVPADPKLAEKMRKRIQSECGKAVRRVDVSFPDGKSIKVVLVVSDERVAGPVCEKVHRIKELAPYHPQFQVMIDKK
jgi:hypothetical protein